MSKEINIYWYYLKIKHGNFGDELSRYLVERLSGYDVKQIFIPSSGFDYLKKSLKLIYRKRLTIKDLPKLIKQFFIRDYLVTIGSIISQINNKKAKIWGSGIISQKDSIKKADFLAVRGKYTQKRLSELGFVPPEIIGDPALLLPIVYQPSCQKTYKLGIIPHYIHLDYINDKLDNDEVLIIDLTNKIEDVINDICSCEYTLSTSLHGLIVSHVYNIPSLWFTLHNMPLNGDDIKFFDYFSSVSITEYNPINIDIENLIIDDVIEIFNNSKDISGINCNLSNLQISLLKTAPFKILDNFKVELDL